MRVADLPITSVRLKPKNKEKLAIMSRHSGLPQSRIIDQLIESATDIEVLQSISVKFEGIKNEE